jgi:hypothetical protein
MFKHLGYGETGNLHHEDHEGIDAEEGDSPHLISLTIMILIIETYIIESAIKILRTDSNR